MKFFIFLACTFLFFACNQLGNKKEIETRSKDIPEKIDTNLYPLDKDLYSDYDNKRIQDSIEQFKKVKDFKRLLQGLQILEIKTECNFEQLHCFIPKKILNKDTLKYAAQLLLDRLINTLRC